MKARDERQAALGLAEQVRAQEEERRRIERALEQRNQLIRQHAKQQRRRFSGEAPTGFGELRA